MPFTIGSAIEFETDDERSRYEFPTFVEYNVSKSLKFIGEANFAHISPKIEDASAVTGVGDLEMGLEYEFVRERRYRPALTAEGLIKWPTATDAAIGDPGTDSSLGLIASKDLVFVEVDLRALYTFVGDAQEQDAIEIAASAVWHLNHRFDIEAEIAHSFGMSGVLGQPGSFSGGGALGRADAGITQGTVGVAWHVSKRFKLEQGAIFGSDGTWQIVFAWEWSFSGD